MSEWVGGVRSLAVERSRWYERWLLLLLVLVYASSFIDRIIIAVVGPALKVEMGLSDLQVGLLSGFAFSIFYATLGIPIARLAERYSRVVLIAISTAAWSVMTMLCGTATGFGWLMTYRVGVGIGEAGSTPTAHSLISDQFPANRRATALGIYALGPPLGVVLGALGGGWVAQHFGWRAAFYVVGMPGLVLGALAYLTLREPKRGQAEGLAVTAQEAVPSAGEVMKVFFREKVFWQMSAGVMTAAVALYGTLMFLPIYLSRVYGMSMEHAGLSFAFVNGGGAIVGGLIGGYGSDWASRRDRRWYAWIPALGSLLAIPLTAASFLTSTWYIGIPLLLLTTIALNVWNGPTFSIVHGLVEPRMRATASALVFLLMNLVGQGLGPTLVGFLSDRFAKYGFTGGDYQALCVLPHGMTPAAEVLMSCHQAAAQGLRYALLVPIVMVVASALLFFLASRHIKR
ncbi:spinster family MFS transporter [Cupriavidus necator]